MRRFYTIIAALVLSATAMAQTLNVRQGQVTYAFPASQTGTMTYSNSGKTLTIGSKAFTVSEIDAIEVTSDEVDDNSVRVAYSGTTASVVIAGNIASYITATVSNAHVTLVQEDGVKSTGDEVTYALSGTSSDGEFYLEGSYKCGLELRGLTLTNPNGPAINIQNGKRIEVSAKKGTTNTLTDGTGGDWKGAFVCKGHTEFKGKGTLTVYGKTAHGIWSKEYVEVKNLTLNVLAAVKDGINCNQYFLMESGDVTISGVGDDGIQVSLKDDDDSAENTGKFTITGGSLYITVTAKGAKAVKAKGGITVSGDDTSTNVTAMSSGGVDDSDSSDLASSACMKSETAIIIDGGLLSLTNTGQGGRAMLCDGTIAINGGTITARAEGANYGSSSSGGGPGGGRPGGGWGWGGGSSSSSNGKNAKGIKAKGAITITGGTVNVYSASHEGIESKSTMDISGGILYAEASDDAINAASNLTVSGGYVYGYSTSNDGIDSNGHFYMKGGVAIGFGAGGAETGIDIDEQHSLQISGGYLLGIGGRVDSKFGTMSQAYGYTTNSGSFSGGYLVVSQGSTRLFAAKMPKTSYSGIVLCSAPAMTSGTSYTVGSATSVSGDETNGFVASPTVSSVSNTKSFTARK